MLMMKWLPIVGLLTLAAAGTFASDAVYRWEDEQGRIHYSDKPTDGAAVVELKEPAKQSDEEADQERLEANRVWFEAQQKRRLAEEKQHAKAAKKSVSGQQKQQQKCERLRNKLADKTNELKAKKRAGLKVSVESRLELQIDVLRQKVKRECG